MIELTDEMRAAMKRRMGLASDATLDIWTEAAVEDVFAIVERDYEVTRREAVEHGLVASEELPAVRWNPAAEEFFVDCLCGETFAGGRGGDALERALRHLAQVDASPKPGDAR